MGDEPAANIHHEGVNLCPLGTARTSFRAEEVKKISVRICEANQAFMARYPGESNRRQAVHVVYGGAHLFKADSAQKLGVVALRSLKEYAPDSPTR